MSNHIPYIRNAVGQHRRDLYRHCAHVPVVKQLSARSENDPPDNSTSSFEKSNYHMVTHCSMRYAHSPIDGIVLPSIPNQSMREACDGADQLNAIGQLNNPSVTDSLISTGISLINYAIPHTANHTSYLQRVSHPMLIYEVSTAMAIIIISSISLTQSTIDPGNPYVHQPMTLSDPSAFVNDNNYL